VTVGGRRRNLIFSFILAHRDSGGLGARTVIETDNKNIKCVLECAGRTECATPRGKRVGDGGGTNGKRTKRNNNYRNVKYYADVVNGVVLK
jgi:hypothetical protein